MSDQNPDSVVAVGVGSAGCRIVSLLSKHSLLIDRFAYISCDKNDFEFVGAGKKVLIDCPVEQKLTPSIVRGLSITVRHTILNAVRGARVVFVVAGLGGATGTGLAPLVAEMAQKSWATVVGVAVMPFDFEKRLRFYAGVSLRRLRAATSGVIVIDNDTLMKSSREGATLKEIYQLANGEAVTVLASLLSKSSETSLPLGLDRQDGRSARGRYHLDQQGSGSEGGEPRCPLPYRRLLSLCEPCGIGGEAPRLGDERSRRRVRRQLRGHLPVAGEPARLGVQIDEVRRVRPAFEGLPREGRDRRLDGVRPPPGAGSPPVMRLNSPRRHWAGPPSVSISPPPRPF